MVTLVAWDMSLIPRAARRYLVVVAFTMRVSITIPALWNRICVCVCVLCLQVCVCMFASVCRLVVREIKSGVCYYGFHCCFFTTPIRLVISYR